MKTLLLSLTLLSIIGCTAAPTGPQMVSVKLSYVLSISTDYSETCDVFADGVMIATVRRGADVMVTVKDGAQLKAYFTHFDLNVTRSITARDGLSWYIH